MRNADLSEGAAEDVLALTLWSSVAPKRELPSAGATKRLLATSNAPSSLQSVLSGPIFVQVPTPKYLSK